MLSVSSNRSTYRNIFQRKIHFLDPAPEVEVARNRHAQGHAQNLDPDHYPPHDLFRRQCAKVRSHQSNRRKIVEESVANGRVHRRQVLGKFVDSGRFISDCLFL